MRKIPPPAALRTTSGRRNRTGRERTHLSRAVFFLLPALLFLFACDDLKEQKGALPNLNAGANAGDEFNDVTVPWDYPYYLVIGGGLSETLSLLTISGPGRFSLANDVQQTGSAINDTTVHQGELFAVCSLSNSVVVYDVRDLSIKREISVGAGHNPIALAFFENDKAFIANLLTNDVSYFDLAGDGGQLDAIHIPAGDELPRDPGVSKSWARPADLAVWQDKLYVVLGNLNGIFTTAGPSLLAVADARSRKMERVITLSGRDATGLFLDRKNSLLYVVSAGDYDAQSGFAGNGIVEVVDTATDKVTGSVHVGGAPFEMVVDGDGTAFLGNGQEGLVLSFDTATLETLPPVLTMGDAGGLGVSYSSALAVDGNGYLYAAEFNHDKLFVIDTRDANRVIADFTVNDGPDTLSFIR